VALFLAPGLSQLIIGELIFQITECDLQLSLIKQIGLKRELFTAGTKLLDLGQGQVLFDQLDVILLLTDLCLMLL